MTDIQNSQHLDTQREQIRNQFASIGDFRPGNLTAFFCKCGKPNCRCAKPEHPRHGSSWILTLKVESKTVTQGCRQKPWSQLACRSTNIIVFSS